MKKKQNFMIFILVVSLLMSAVSLQPDKDSVLSSGKESSDTAIIYPPHQEQADIAGAIVSEGRALRQSLMLSSRMRVRADYNRSRLGVAFPAHMTENHRISNIFYMSVICGYNVRISSNAFIMSFIHNQDGQKA